MATAEERAARGHEELLSGWGRGHSTRAELLRPNTAAELEGILSKAAGPLIARGLGRAYGDAAQSAGGTVIDMTGLCEILDLDLGTGLLRAEAGLSIDALLREVVPLGWFIPVTPGTRLVTLGGAVAADVHGKNHHRDGSLGVHLEMLRLLTPSGTFELGPDREPELFWATIGGMGLTGMLSEVALRLTSIETAYMRVDTDRAADLEECMAMLADGDDRYRYSVAWVDCVAGGRSLGRSVLTRGDHARQRDLSGQRADAPLSYEARTRLSVPFPAPGSPVRPGTVRALNEVWFRKAPRHAEGEIQPFSTFFYPLDGVGDWNLLYGRRGFTQYQLVVPFGAEWVIRSVLESLQQRHLSSCLGVLKRFGAADAAPLSFPRAGWTLALDLPLARAGLPEALDDLDHLVLEAGGRVYLAKDGRLSPSHLHAMYPRIPEWRRTVASVDPAGVLASDLANRLHLREPRDEDDR
jgi:decaprenylphospho-beta-D-ribofuranose 2-oxidase